MKKSEIKEQQTTENILKSFKLSQYVYFGDKSQIKKITGEWERRVRCGEQGINPMKTTTKKQNSFYRFRSIEDLHSTSFMAQVFDRLVILFRFPYSLSLTNTHIYTHRERETFHLCLVIFFFTFYKKNGNIVVTKMTKLLYRSKETIPFRKVKSHGYYLYNVYYRWP